jgi:hypothetical protein
MMVPPENARGFSIMLGIALVLFLDQENNGSRPPTLVSIGQNKKENILFKDPLQSILVKGVAIETSPEIRIKIMA